MSVAFRRDSDEEHLEPRFELPLPPGPNLVTARGAQLIDARIAALEVELAEAAGDDRIAELRRDLRYWRARKASARPMPAGDGDEAGFGSRVRFRRGTGMPTAIDIVGQDEADPASGRIAFSAPLARALIGGAVGDRVDFGGGAPIEILTVAPIPE